MISHRRHVSTLIANGPSRVGFDPRWYGEGPPQWVEAACTRRERNSRTAAEARELRERSVRLLGRYGKQDRAALSLAERLEACPPRRRCMSGACPECGRAFQRWFVANSRDLIRQLDGGALLMVTIVPDYGRCPLDELKNFNVEAVWRRTKRYLAKAGVRVAFGGLDFSVNVDGKDGEPYVQVQCTLFVPKKLWPKSDRELRIALNRSGEVARPMLVRGFDGDNAGLAYALKPTFHRRESYPQAADARRDGRSSANTRNRPLRGTAWTQLAVFLDRMGLGARLCLIGVKRVRKYEEVTMRRIE
jgi:hypothetical protein